MVRVETVDFDLERLLEDTLNLAWTDESDKHVDFAAVRAQLVPRGLRGDLVRLRQVLVALAGNALERTTRGHVLVRADLVHDDGEHVDVRFSVEDTGLGISADEGQGILAGFLPADGSPTQKLCVSRHLVRAMGGEIIVDSAVGRGSTFSFRLRMQKQRVQPKAKAHAFRGARAIVAADAWVMRQVLAHYLTDCGMKAMAAPLDRLHALLDAALAAAKPFDMAVIDCNNADPSYLSKVATLVDDPRLARLPVVLVVPNNGTTPDDTAFPAVTQKLRKPVHRSDVESLLASVEAIGAAPLRRVKCGV